MNYDLKYPNLEPIWGNGDADNILKGREEKPCYKCYQPTFFVELSFEAPICSEECSKVAWQEYAFYCEQNDPPP